MQVCHTVQGEKGLTQRLAVLREIGEGFSEEAASELRSEGSKAPSPGNELAGGEGRLGVPPAGSTVCTTARGENKVGILRRGQAVQEGCHPRCRGEGRVKGGGREGQSTLPKSFGIE